MLLFLLLIASVLNAEVNIDLKDPIYSEGVLCTSSGGVITADEIRIQAKTITYVKGENSLTAEGLLMVNYGPHLFVGEKIIYNLDTGLGVIEGGRGSLFPWSFGGGKITLLPGGSFHIENALFTTSESRSPDWSITVGSATLLKDRTLCGQNVRINILKTPIFWFPRFKTNLDFIFDNPMRIYFRTGGRRGTRAGLTYKLYTRGPWDLFLHLDYRLFKGPGGGFETKYASQDGKIRFETINYIARDTSIANPVERMRYRLQGAYHRIIPEQKTTINLTYDYLSDKYMATDYVDTTLKFLVPERTELQIKRQDSLFITNLFAKVKVNEYQSLKQELPTLQGVLHPINVAGLIFEQRGSLSYLDYDYSEKLCHTHDFHSFRACYLPTLYGCFSRGINITPEARGVFIFYQNTPKKEFLATGFFDVEMNLILHKNTRFGRHSLKPYLLYEGVLSPTANPNQHYIFDIEDGWSRLNTVRIGLKQGLYRFDMRPLDCDLFAYAFIDTKTLPKVVPRVYGNATFQMTPFIRHIFETAWDFDHNDLAHINGRLEWTASRNAALTIEYRHRNRYDFRKVDYFNFMMESFRTEQELVHSTLSDRRDTLLCHFFWRFNREWALEFTSRSGWQRVCEPNYMEYEINLAGTLRSAWNVRLAYQFLENDHRFVFGLSLGLKKPNQWQRQLPRALDY